MPTSGTSRRPWVYIGGTFDLLHPGHINLFKEAFKHGHVVVALNTDDFAARYKRRPVMRLHERYAVVRACRYVTAVCVNEGDEDSKPTIERWRPRYVVHGDDWTGDALMAQMGLTQGWMDDRGIAFLYLPYTTDVSSSDIIARAVDSACETWVVPPL